MKNPPISSLLVRISLSLELLNQLTSVVLHPYFKLAYIEVAWGGPAEQEAERKAGNPLAKDWQDEARRILESIVRVHSSVDATYLTCIYITDGALLQEPASYKPNANSAPPYR